MTLQITMDAIIGAVFPDLSGLHDYASISCALGCIFVAVNRDESSKLRELVGNGVVRLRGSSTWTLDDNGEWQPAALIITEITPLGAPEV